MVKTHFYKTRNNSSNSSTYLSERLESILYDVIPEDSLLTEDIIFSLYDMKRASKPSEYPSMSRISISQRLKNLTEKKFLTAFDSSKLRNSLRLGR